MSTALTHDFDQINTLRGQHSVKWDTYGPDVLPMWIADADFTCPAPIVEAVAARAAMGVYGYTHIEPGFAEAVCHWRQTRFNDTVAPESVSFLHAIVPALVDAVHTFTRPGEKVLIQTPVYPPFHHAITESGRIKVTSPLRHENGQWHIDFDHMEAVLADPDLRLFILCSPHNPVGRVFTAHELRRMGELCLKHHVVLIADEIHADLVFAPHRHTAFTTLGPELAANSLTFISPSKTFNTPGLRAAASIIPNPDLRAAFCGVMERSKTAEPSLFGPIALEAAYTRCAYYADQVRDYIEANIDLAVAALNAVPGIRVHKPEGTYLLWLDCRELCASRSLSQQGLVRLMLESAKVAMNSGTNFGPEGEGFLRMNTACPRARVTEAVKRIASV